MLSAVLFAAGALLGAANAQLPEVLKGKVAAITGPASTTCSNKYINNTAGSLTIDDVLCDTRLVPEQFQQYIPGLKFGANSPACAGYACALRFLGCVDATYRAEVKIVTATGQAESCDERTGLNTTMCQTIGALVSSVPVVGRKRDVDELIEPFTQAELDAEVAIARQAQKLEPIESNLHFIKLLVRAYLPAESALLGLAEDDTLERYAARKRDTFDEILKRTQLCSPTISAGVDLLVAQMPSLATVKGKFGPCGQFCEMAMCGLTLMCHGSSRSALLSLEAQRVTLGCNRTSCSTWAPPSKVCPSTPSCSQPGQFAPNTLTLETCAPPKQIRSASQLDPNDCCDRCEDKCASVVCQVRSVEDCGAPAWPLCKPFVVEREDPYRCCGTCNDGCKTASCPPPPLSCPSGTFPGPTNSSTCCQTCVELCTGVVCPNAPTEEDCRAQGKEWQLKDRKTLGANSQCADCCPQCVGKGTVVTETVSSPPTTSLSPNDPCATIGSEITAECGDELASVDKGDLIQLKVAAGLGVATDETKAKCASLRAVRVCFAEIITRHPSCTTPLNHLPTSAAASDVRRLLPACEAELAELLAKIDCDFCDAVPTGGDTSAASSVAPLFVALLAMVWLVWN